MAPLTNGIFAPSKSGPSMVPLASQLGSKRPSMLSLASRTAWEVSSSQKSSSNANFVRPDCPPVESSNSIKNEKKSPELDQTAAKSFGSNKYSAKPRFRSALEQVSWMNSKLWEENEVPATKGKLGFLGL